MRLQCGKGDIEGWVITSPFQELALTDPALYFPAMKFFLALIVYLLIAAVLGWGMLLMVKGSPWLLIVSFLAYCVAFGKLGCLPGKSHH